MYDVDVLMDKIAELEYPDDIARLIQSHGVTGCRERARSCALSQMFRETTNATYAAFGLVGSSISTSEFDFNDEDEKASEDFMNNLMHYDNSDAMTNFIHAFDSGHYPALECDHPYHFSDD